MKAFLGFLIGMAITIVVYEEHEKPRVIKLALKNAELTRLHSERQKKIKQQRFEVSIQERIEQENHTKLPLELK